MDNLDWISKNYAISPLDVHEISFIDLPEKNLEFENIMSISMAILEITGNKHKVELFISHLNKLEKCIDTIDYLMSYKKSYEFVMSHYIDEELTEVLFKLYDEISIVFGKYFLVEVLALINNWEVYLHVKNYLLSR